MVGEYLPQNAAMRDLKQGIAGVSVKAGTHYGDSHAAGAGRLRRAVLCICVRDVIRCSYCSDLRSDTNKCQIILVWTKI